MAILNQKRILNLIPKVSAPVTIHVSQGDVGTEIEFTLVKGDEVFSNTGNLTASVHGVREDGANFGPFACTLSGSKVTFPLHSEMTAVKGSAIAEIVLVDNGGNKVGSANFGILVEQSVFPLGVTYDNDVSVYESILAYVQSSAAQITASLSGEISARTNADTLINTRIDEIIAPTGEAPNPAEIVDARIGANGTTYNTLGNAIRNQISDVSNFIAVITGTVPYNGGLSALRTDPAADTSKKYLMALSTSSNFLRVMAYDDNLSDWVYETNLINLDEFKVKVIKDLFGFNIIADHNRMNEAPEHYDKGSTYVSMYESSGGSWYRALLYYNYTTKEWHNGGVKLKPVIEEFSRIYGAYPYGGGISNLNAQSDLSNPDLDTSKVYYVPTADKYPRKFRYYTEGETPSWQFDERVILDLEDTYREWVDSIVGVRPIMANLSEIAGNHFVDLDTIYYNAIPNSSFYLKKMHYSYDYSTWVYDETVDMAGKGHENFQIENPLVHEYMVSTLYDNSNYGYSNVRTYAKDDCDRPLAYTARWAIDTDPEYFIVKVSLTGDFDKDSYEYQIEGTMRETGLNNLIPGVDAAILISTPGFGFWKTVRIHPIGQVRMLAVNGVKNVRDIGGWKCDGGKVAYNKVIRGGHLNDITSAGIFTLHDKIKVKTEIDLTATASPTTSVIGSGVTKYSIAGYSYVSGFNDTASAYNVFSRLFTEVVDDNIVYIHCYGGCDRTAFYMAMVEGLLGVSESDITKDFELSSFMNKSDSNGYRRYRSMGTEYSNRDWKGLMDAVKALTGNSLQEKIYNYFISLGFTAEQINQFKAKMIEN